MVTAKFTFNNKIYIVTKSLLFKVNYGWKLGMGFEIRKREKHAKVEKFVKEMKEIHKKVKVVLKKYVDRNRR